MSSPVFFAGCFPDPVQAFAGIPFAFLQGTGFGGTP